MALFHYLHFRAFAHETEDPDKVREALRNAARVPELAFEETVVEGSHKNRIRILEAEVRSAPAAKQVFAAIRRDDPEGFAALQAQARERLDEHLNFHLRLDKQEAYLGRLALAQGDDAITVRGKIRSFGSKRSGATVEGPLRQLEAFLLEVAARPEAGLDSKAKTFKNKETIG